MLPSTWITSKLAENNNDTTTLYMMYEQFKKETGSNQAYDSYKRTVRKYIGRSNTFIPSTVTDNKGVKVEREEAGPNLNIVTTSSEIRTLDQLLAYCRVDLTEYEVTKHVINSWGKDENENFQVKAWLSKKEADTFDFKEETKHLLNDIKNYAPVYPKINYKKSKEKNRLLEIALYDHHFGQLSWGQETGGANYDSEIAYNLAMDAVDNLLSRTDLDRLEKISIPIGNDFFNVNGATNTTFAGTPQTEDGRWKKTFVRGRELWINIIEKCMQIAPVDVIVVPGNHDFERTFYLGESLSCWFSKSKDVHIDNSPNPRKYYVYGNTLSLYTHGDKEVNNTIHYIMATDKPDLWGKIKYKEVKKGHVHHKTSISYQTTGEDHGVRIVTYPSLVSLDDWHSGKGYSSLRESTAIEYDREAGRIAEYFWRPKD